MIIWCTSEKIRTASQRKNLMEKAEADLEKDKKSELLTKQQERIQKRVVSLF